MTNINMYKYQKIFIMTIVLLFTTTLIPTSVLAEELTAKQIEVGIEEQVEIDVQKEVKEEGKESYSSNSINLEDKPYEEDINKNNIFNSHWEFINNKWYYFHEDGFTFKGWLELNTKWYYLNNEGIMEIGFIDVNGKRYYLDNDGVMNIGWLHTENKWYYFNGSGDMETGWISVNNKWYYLNSDGVMATGWINLNNKWYYLNGNGEMLTGLVNINGRKFYLDSNGVMQTGWILLQNKWYYFSSNGHMETGWITVNNRWYYLNSDGTMATGWINVNNKKYYLNSNGEMLTGWNTINNTVYYFNVNGDMVSNQVVDGYYINSNGGRDYKILTEINYGKSGQNRDLKAYKIGNGSKVLIAVFELHGYEDAWARDGEELVKIGEKLIQDLTNQCTTNKGLNDWTVYIIPSANPDGLAAGWTNNGPGRTTVAHKVDLNRAFPSGFVANYTSRYYTGATSLGAPEARNLYNFILDKTKNAKEKVVIDVHGWLNETIGNAQLGQYFSKEFGFKHKTSYGSGYLTTWTKSIGAKSVLVELPMPSSSKDVQNRDFAGKVSRAVSNIIRDL